MAAPSRKLTRTHILAIFFDLDNTLISTRRGDQLASKKVQCLLEDKYDVPRSAASDIVIDFLANFRNKPESPVSSLESWRKSLWSDALGIRYNNFAGEIAEQWTKWRYEYLQPDNDVVAMLQMLKSHYLLALITNGYSRSQWEKIRRLDLERYFASIVVSGDWCWEKPSKAIFMAACEQLGVTPGSCIMVGDRLETDILGAHNANLAASVWVPFEDTRLQVDVSADFVIDDVTLLPQLLPAPRRDLSRYFNLSEPESENSNSSETS